MASAARIKKKTFFGPQYVSRRSLWTISEPNGCSNGCMSQPFCMLVSYSWLARQTARIAQILPSLTCILLDNHRNQRRGPALLRDAIAHQAHAKKCACSSHASRSVAAVITPGADKLVDDALDGCDALLVKQLRAERDAAYKARDDAVAAKDAAEATAQRLAADESAKAAQAARSECEAASAAALEKATAASAAALTACHASSAPSREGDRGVGRERKQATDAHAAATKDASAQHAAALKEATDQIEALAREKRHLSTSTTERWPPRTNITSRPTPARWPAKDEQHRAAVEESVALLNSKHEAVRSSLERRLKEDTEALAKRHAEELARDAEEDAVELEKAVNAAIKSQNEKHAQVIEADSSARRATSRCGTADE